jgi:lipid A 3-O-deacylase
MAKTASWTTWINLVAILWMGGEALAQTERPTHSFYLENDVFVGTDRHYTNGLRYQRMQIGHEIPRWARWALEDYFEVCQPNLGIDCYSLQKGFAVTQLMFTPEDVSGTELIRDDRPYGGWLRLESNFVLSDGKNQHRFDGVVGVIGQESFAGGAQRILHTIINSERPRGWGNQLDTEIGLMLLYRGSNSGFELWNGDETLRWFSASPHWVGAVGNVFTYGGGGGTVRLGYNITDPLSGPIPIQGVATTSTNSGPSWEIYAFAGVEGRALARNLFLDGNTFSNSHSVDKKTFVHDRETGVFIRWKRYVVVYRTITRSREFKLQDEEQHWGSLSFTIRGSF